MATITIASLSATTSFSLGALFEIQTSASKAASGTTIKSMMGISGTPLGVLYATAGNPATSVASSNTKTTLMTYSVPGGTLGTAGIIRGTCRGDLLNNGSSNCTFTISVDYGGTTLCTFALANGAPSATVAVWTLDFILSARAATNAQYFTGTCVQNQGSSNGASASALTAFMLVGEHNTCAEDSTGALALKVSITMNQNNAGDVTKLYAGSYEKIA